MSRVRFLAALLLFCFGVRSTLAIKDVGWWKNMPFYQIYPRSFMDSNDDGIGDLKGITSKLGHFVDAGIGAIWLSPIYASPMKDFGYDISNFTAIATEYGTMEDFEELTRTAKSLGLRVILDLVPNHASDQHEWFKKSVKKIEPYTDFFVWRAGDPESPPNNWISVFGGSAWTYNEERGEWYFHQFLAEQPDLNYNNTVVEQAMAEVILFWLDKGVDGFRVDAVPHLFEIADFRDEPRANITGAKEDEYTYLDHIYTKDQPETYQLVRKMRDLLDKYAEDHDSHERVMMTEAYTSLQKTVEFYDAGAHVPFNFKFITDVDSTSKPNDFKNIIDTWMDEANERNGTANWVMGNHDRVRTESRYPGRGDQMTMLAMILPGVSVTYYGEEIGMIDKAGISFEDTVDPQGCQAGRDRYMEKSRDPCRTPFQWSGQKNAGFSKANKTWLPVNENYETLNLESQKLNPRSHYNLFRNLTKLKASSQALKNGGLKTLVCDADQVLTIVRTHTVNSVPQHVVILTMNFNETENAVVDLSNEVSNVTDYRITVEIATTNSSLRHGAQVNLTEVTLAPKSAVVILADKRNGAARDSISFIMKATVLLVTTLSMICR